MTTTENTSTSANAQAANVDPPAQAATTTPNAQAATDNSEQITFEEARRLRSESVNLRKRLKSYEDADEAAKAAALSEVEKANKRSAEAEAKVQTYQKQLAEAHVKLAAKSMDFHNPDIAAKVIWESLEFGDDGMPTNVEKTLEDLAKSNPFLLKSTTEQATSPAQTANNSKASAIPAMNPDRTHIASPTAQPPGRIPRLTDPGMFKS